MMETETGKKAVCPVCRRAFRDNYTMRMHAKSHSLPARDSPMKCPDCCKCFSVRAAYTNHLKIHQTSAAARPIYVLMPDLETLMNAEKEEVDGEDGSSHPFVDCFVCLGKVRCNRLARHMKRHVGCLMKICEDAGDTLLRFEPRLHPECDPNEWSLQY